MNSSSTTHQNPAGDVSDTGAVTGVDRAASSPSSMRPALLVIDMQEDFCPPNGPLAIPDARTLAPSINSLLSRSDFIYKIATLDYHPPDHVSFCTSHPPPNNQPFVSYVNVRSTRDPSCIMDQRLWPPHCVQATPGATIIPEILTASATSIDAFVHKGMKRDMEMYSVFSDSFGNMAPHVVEQHAVDRDVKRELHERGVTDVFVVGVAGDYCVKFTALDAVAAGFTTWVVEEGIKCVDGEEGWVKTRYELEQAGVKVISRNSDVLAEFSI